MHGWRGMLGNITPSRGHELVYDFYKMAPPGVTLMITTPGLTRRYSATKVSWAANGLTGD